MSAVRSSFVVATVLALGILGQLQSPAPSSAGARLREFAIPTAHCWPAHIAAGPDGALWFTENQGYGIGRITVDGKVTEFRLPSKLSPVSIAVGPDGALWFTEFDVPVLGRMTTAGGYSELPLPETPQDAPTIGNPKIYARGGDGIASSGGYLWVTGLRDAHSPLRGDAGFSNGIARVSPDGGITVFTIPHRAGPSEIHAGRDGNVWFTEAFANEIGSMTMAGVLTEYAMPKGVVQLRGIAQAADGAVWATDGSVGVGGYSTLYGGSVVRMSLDGTVHEFAMPSAPSAPVDIVADSRGTMWFSELGGSRIGSIDAKGAIREFDIPETRTPPYTGPPLGSGVTIPKFESAGPTGIVIGPDGALWFTETYKNAIGRLDPDALAP